MRSSLARHQSRRPADEDQLFAMRRAAWLKEGIAVIRPADLTDEWERQAVINLANRLYGDPLAAPGRATGVRHGKA